MMSSAISIASSVEAMLEVRMFCGTGNPSLRVMKLPDNAHAPSAAYNATITMSKPAMREVQPEYRSELCCIHLSSARQAVSCLLASAAPTRMHTALDRLGW
jgi:hypothetical protein